MPPPPDPNAVFLNIPFDAEFRSLYIAYIVGLIQLGMVPHLASEIAGGERRLNRIFQLIQGCRYSIHDLSRIEVSGAPVAVPRFNMPLELGMTITWSTLNPDVHDLVCMGVGAASAAEIDERSERNRCLHPSRHARRSAQRPPRQFSTRRSAHRAPNAQSLSACEWRASFGFREERHA